MFEEKKKCFKQILNKISEANGANIFQNTAGSIRKVAQFLQKSVSDEDVLKLCEHLKIDNFRKNVMVHTNVPMKGVINDYGEAFIRTGK